MSSIVVGIDVSKKDLAVSILHHNSYRHRVFANNSNGFQALDNWLSEHQAKVSKVCLESTGIYSLSVANYLHEHCYAVSMVNPACIKHYAASKLSRHKNDKVDSKIIAEYASKNELRLYQPKDDTVSQIHGLSQAITHLEQQQQQYSNWLESRVHLPQQVCDLYEQNIAYFKRQIAQLNADIDDLVAQSAELANKVVLLTSIPGIGKKTAIKLMSNLPDLKYFDSPRQLAAFMGLTPKQCSSGSSINKKKSYF